MIVFSWVVGGFYALFPLFVIFTAIRDARRTRTKKPIVSIIATYISAAAIAIFINLAYAHAAAAKWKVSEVLLATYFVAAVLFTLKEFDAWLKKTISRRLKNHPKIKGLGPVKYKGSWTLYFGTAVRVVILFVLGIPYVMGVAMVYRVKVIGPDPMEQFGIRFQDVAFSSRDGETLSGWWLDAGSDHTVVLCHGLGSSKSNALPIAEPLYRAGYNVLAFDFRAHGASSGHVTSFGVRETRDVLGAVGWLRRERPSASRHIYGVGASMGAAALIAAAADDSPEGRAIDAIAVYGTYDDLSHLADTVCDRNFPRPLNWLARYIAIPIAQAHAGVEFWRFVPGNMLDALAPRPLLVIHGKEDEIIAFQHGQHLFNRAPGAKQSLWIEGADHNSVLMDPNASRTVKAFFDVARERDVR